MENHVLLHGKHVNRTFAQAETDRPYCAWVLRAPSLQQSSLRLFQFYLRQRHDGIFTVGRHKGEWFDEVPKVTLLLFTAFSRSLISG